MKTTVLAAAALLGGASAHNRHAHQAFHKRQNDTGVVCSAVYETVTGTDFICMSSSQPLALFPESGLEHLQLSRAVRERREALLTARIQGRPRLMRRLPTRHPRPHSPATRPVPGRRPSRRLSSLRRLCRRCLRLVSIYSIFQVSFWIYLMLICGLGTYTFPESTLTVSETLTEAVPSTTPCSPGTYTLGGVVT